MKQYLPFCLGGFDLFSNVDFDKPENQYFSKMLLAKLYFITIECPQYIYIFWNKIIIETFQLCEYYYLFGNENSRGTVLKLREGKQPNGSQLPKNLRGP